MKEKKMVFRKKLLLEYWKKFDVSVTEKGLSWADECEGMTFDETKRATNNITVSEWFSEEETENETEDEIKDLENILEYAKVHHNVGME